MEAQDETWITCGHAYISFNPVALPNEKKTIVTHKHILYQHSLREKSSCWKLLDNLTQALAPFRKNQQRAAANTYISDLELWLWAKQCTCGRSYTQ